MIAEYMLKRLEQIMEKVAAELKANTVEQKRIADNSVIIAAQLTRIADLQTPPPEPVPAGVGVEHGPVTTH